MKFDKLVVHLSLLVCSTALVAQEQRAALKGDDKIIVEKSLEQAAPKDQTGSRTLADQHSSSHLPLQSKQTLGSRTKSKWKSVVVRSDGGTKRVNAASPTAFQPITPLASVTWFTDLVLAPSRARDRQTMRVYRLRELQPKDYDKLLALTVKGDVKVALVQTSPLGSGVSGLAKEAVYIGTPLIYDENAKDWLQELAHSNDLGVVTEFVLRSAGFKSVSVGDSPPESGTYLAVSSDVDLHADSVSWFVTSKAAWPTN